MISHSKLRIGNWVYSLSNRPPGPVQIKELKYDGVSKEHPMPLTPEILEMCGFNQTSETTTFYLNGETVKENEEKILIKNGRKYKVFKVNNEFALVVTIGNNSFEIATFKYLHQLQNLYFALTGEELPVKLHELSSHSAT